MGDAFCIFMFVKAINKLAEKVVNIEDEKFHEYLGNYDYYKEQKVKKLSMPTSRRK